MNSYASAQSSDARVIDLKTYKLPTTTCEANEERWPAWKTSLFIFTTCGAFWASIAIAIRAIF
ncbi:hypothetical protein [Hirschia litorea]|uniref:Uncharacterized protein n=1 Tax=Hirschia litorea TaxID=1199156 RepID=A0ABW2IGJ7_9PROT